MEDDREPWSILVSVPTHDDRYWRSEREYNVYVYLLPSADNLAPPHRPYAGRPDFEEIGEDNFLSPDGVRQWYESAPLSNPDTPIGQLSASLQWADGHASEVRPIKWHLDGWGCAFFRVLEGLRQAEELRIQVTLGALLLADTLVQPSIGHRRLTEFENLHHYLSGGERLLTSDFLASRIFASYSRKDRWVVDAVESVLALLDSVHFVWDLRVLKAGELWNKRILSEIERADIFQLFWSQHASASRHVKTEYVHALALARPRFVRPVYWEEPMPTPPRVLRDIHFARIRVGQTA